MTKTVLQQTLQADYQLFCQFLNEMSLAQFECQKEGKWTPGQQLQHMVLSVRPVRLIMMAPKWILALVWRKSNRPSKSFDGLVEKYKLKLAQGGRASKMFQPKWIAYAQHQKLTKALQTEVQLLNNLIEQYSENDLDTYLLPHPLLGKLTIREMLYFTIYHVAHHKASIEHLYD